MKKSIASLIVASLVFTNAFQSNSIVIEAETIQTRTSSATFSISSIIKQHRALEKAYNTLLDYADTVGTDDLEDVLPEYTKLPKYAKLTAEILIGIRNAKAYLEFLPFAVFADAVLEKDIKTEYNEVLLISEEGHFEVLKEDSSGFKIKYTVDGNDIELEKFNNGKNMYMDPSKADKTYAYQYIYKKGQKTKVNFTSNAIKVHSIINGFACTDYGFIDIKDLTTKKKSIVSSITLSKPSTIKKSDTITLKPTVSPSNTSKELLKWSSSNTKVATVDSNGKVKGISAGSAYITCKAIDNSGKSAKVEIKVSNNLDKAPTINAKDRSINVGQTFKLQDEIKNKHVTVTDDKDKDLVNKLTIKKSNVDTKKTGTYSVTYSVKDSGGNTTEKTIKVTVNKVSVKSVKLNSSSLTLNSGSSKSLTATVSPSNASNKKVSWKSSNTSIATVTQSGSIKAIKPGTVTITATTEDGKKVAKCNVKVNPYKQQSVKFEINVDKSFRAKHYVEVLDGNDNVLWTSVAGNGSRNYNFTYTLNTSNISYKRKIRIRQKSNNKKYKASKTFTIDKNTINKKVIAKVDKNGNVISITQK